MDNLSIKDRDFLIKVMSQYLWMTNAQIAKILNVSCSTVKISVRWQKYWRQMRYER